MSIYITDSNGKRHLIAGTAAPVVDAALNSNSIAAVQNRVVTAALNTKVNKADIVDLESLRVLPQEYQEVEYIESTGTQYINTEYVTKYGDTVEIEFEYTTINNAYNFLYGATSPTNNDPVVKFGINYYTDAYVPIMEIVAASYRGDPLYAFNKKVYKMVLASGSQSLYIDDIKVAAGTESAALPNYTAFLFASNNGNNTYVAGNQSNGRLYKAIIKSGATLVREFIPCYRKSDGVIGLYDTINKVFYTNQGTGTFLKGENIYLSNVARRNDAEVVFAENERQKSKNLFNATISEKTSGSMTYSADTGKLYISGTYTDGSRCQFGTWSLKKGTYTICLKFASGSMTRFNSIKFGLYKGTSWSQYIECPNISDTVLQVYETFTLDEDVDDATLMLYQNLNNTMTDCVFEYQIVSGSVPDFDFQPYQGGNFIQEKQLKEAVEKRNLLFDHTGSDTIDITDSILTTLKEYWDLFNKDKQKTYKCYKAGNAATTNFSTLLGNPLSATYLFYYVRQIIQGTDDGYYHTYEVIVRGSGDGLAVGYIMGTPNMNTVVFTGWTKIGG